MQNILIKDIVNLPSKLALHICKHMEDAELLNVFEAIHASKSLASTTWFQDFLTHRILDWSWIDRYIYKCLFPQKSASSFQNPRAALEYRVKQDEFYAEQPQNSQCFPTRQYLRFAAFRATHAEMEIDFQRSGFLPLYPYKSERKSQDKKSSDLFHYDGAIYFAEMSSSAHADLKMITKALLPHQTLVVVVTRDVETDDRNDLTCLTDFFNYLGGVDGSPLGRALVHWRMWCIHREEKRKIDMGKMGD